MRLSWWAALAWSAVAIAQAPDWAFSEARCEAITCHEAKVEGLLLLPDGGSEKFSWSQQPWCMSDLVGHPCSTPCLSVYESLDGGMSCGDGSKPAGWQSFGALVYPVWRPDGGAL